jgi:hypothetical protein
MHLKKVANIMDDWHSKLEHSQLLTSTSSSKLEMNDKSNLGYGMGSINSLSASRWVLYKYPKSAHCRLASRALSHPRLARVSIILEAGQVKRTELASSADLGGSSKYSNEIFED